MHTEVDLIKEPFLFPKLTSEINARDAALFIESRYLDLFWCEDLCSLPEEEGEGLGIWARYSRNARQAVALDLATSTALKQIVGRSTLTLHNLCTWYLRSPEKCKKQLENAVPGKSLGRVLILLDVLTIDPEMKKKLREEFKNRELKKKTLTHGYRVEDVESLRRGNIDVFQSTGTGQLKGKARSGNQEDDFDLLSYAASALHEIWRQLVPKTTFWKQISEEEYINWYDPRFHAQLVRSPMGQRLVNLNAPHSLLPPSMRSEGMAVAKSCLSCIQRNKSCDHIDLIANEVHLKWLDRRRIEWEEKAKRMEEMQQQQDKEDEDNGSRRPCTPNQPPPISTLSSLSAVAATIVASSQSAPPIPDSTTMQKLHETIDVPKWTPIRAEVPNSQCLHELRRYSNEDDRCVVIICIDAFQTVADRAPMMTEMAVQPVTVSVHKQVPISTHVLDHLRERAAKATANYDLKKKTIDKTPIQAADIVKSLGQLRASSIVNNETRIGYDYHKNDEYEKDGFNSFNKKDDIKNRQPFIYRIDLSQVDLVSTTTPAPSTTHFLSSLSNHQNQLFNEMRPLAKRVLMNMDQEMKTHINKSKNELRYRIDAASLLMDAPTLEKSIRLTPQVNGAGGLGSPQSLKASSKQHSKELAAILNPSNPNLIATLQILNQVKENLRELMLQNCGLGAGAMSRLRKDGLVKCMALTTLDLSDNPLGSEGAAVVARTLSSLPLLKCLGMRNTRCAGEGAHLLFRALKYHRVMTVDVSNNSLGSPEAEGMHGPVMRALKALLRNNNNLTHLDLSWNALRKDMCMKIGEWIKGNRCLYGLHITGNKGCTVDSRGFIRRRSNLATTKISPAYIIDYPKNPIQLPNERCWICGRWSERQIVLELECTVLPIAPQRKSGDSVSAGGASKASKRQSVSGRSKRRGSQSSAMSASSAGTSDRAGSSDYDHIVVTCHLSIDDPPFSAAVMDEQDPEEDRARPTFPVANEAMEMGDGISMEGAMELSVESKSIKKYFVLNRMLPPGEIQYYFMVFGDGKPLLRYNGPKLDPNAPHNTYFKHPPSRKEEVANFGALIRPDIFQKDTEESHKLPTVQPKCGFAKIDTIEEFIEIVQEERVNDFQCVNLDEEEEEEEEVEEVIEEVDWHPRDSIFESRRDATGGSFLDAVFDLGPQEKEMTAAELADSIDGKTGQGHGAASKSQSLAKDNTVTANGGDEVEEEEEEKVTDPPLTLAFNEDARILRNIMESGTKKARAFFPNEITDLFLAAEAKDPKPSHRAHDEERRTMLMSFLMSAVTAEAEARTAKMEKLGFESIGPTTTYDSESSEEVADPVQDLFATLQLRYSSLQGVYRYYSCLNSRNPFSMSVHTWLALCKETGIDKLVCFDTPGSKSKKKTAVDIGGGEVGGRGGENASLSSNASENKQLNKKKYSTSDHEDNSSKMALEVIFFTATSSGGDEVPEHASAIDLNYSKHDMRRHEFILALMALARYRQRRMVRQDKKENKKDKFLTSLYVNDSREQWSAMSFNEFLDILDLDIISKLEKGHSFNGDTFREEILYLEPVANIYDNFETTIRFNYSTYKLSPMGCGRKYTQLPLSAFIRMMKDCGVLGDLVSSQDISQAFMESRMVRDCELVAGDRCLSLVDLMEALLRLAFKIQNLWPTINSINSVEHDSPKKFSLESGNSFDQYQFGSLDEYDDFGSFKEVTKEEAKAAKKEEEAQKEKDEEELDPMVQSAHRSLRCILELLLMALKDRDTPGLRFLFQERKRKEIERLVQLQRLSTVPPSSTVGYNTSPSNAPVTAPTNFPISNVLNNPSDREDISPLLSPLFISEGASEAAVAASVDTSEDIKTALASLEKITSQAIYIQRTSKTHSEAAVGGGDRTRASILEDGPGLPDMA